jgi:hypothetical protein
VLEVGKRFVGIRDLLGSHVGEQSDLATQGPCRTIRSVPGSWTTSAASRDEWIAFVRELVEGSTLASVRYVDIDYRRHELGIGSVGPRTITEPSEWSAPTYEFPGGHTIDYGVEFVTTESDVWSVTWIPPGQVEGLAIDRGGIGLHASGDIAVWEVSGRAPWRECMGQRIVQVEPEFEPWDGADTWWCRRIRIRFQSVVVEFLLAQGLPDGSAKASMDNLVVRYERA